MEQMNSVITLKDLARRANVSSSTVSRILHSPRSRRTHIYSEETRRRIQQLADELGYRPNLVARSFRTRRTFTLGMICGDLDTPFFSEMASHAMLEAERHDYELLVSVTKWKQERELKCLEGLLARRVDGVIMMGWGLRPGVRVYDEIARGKFPLVIIGPEIEGLACVVSDRLSGMRQAIAHFQNAGHLRVGYIGHSEGYLPDAKIQPFLQVCTEMGVESKVYYCDLRAEAARHLGRQLAKEPGRPKALIAPSDYIAMGIIRGLADEGVRVPDDLAVMGVDGTKTGEFFIPALTTIAQDQQEMTSKAIGMLLRMIETKDIRPETVKIPTELIVRDSA